MLMGSRPRRSRRRLDLTEAQFRRIKWRAKKEFARLSQSAQLSESQTRKSAASEGTAVSNLEPEKPKEPITGT
jgi:hypothetical protein